MAAITEDFISFETAKLLKEKNCPDFGYSCICDSEGNKAQTQSIIMKWLREVYKIHIQIWILEEKGYWFDIEKILNVQYKHKSLYSTGLEDIYFDTYEQAAETAIKYCLENLVY